MLYVGRAVGCAAQLVVTWFTNALLQHRRQSSACRCCELASYGVCSRICTGCPSPGSSRLQPRFSEWRSGREL